MQVFDTALLVSAVTIMAPILLATVGELVSERAGVMNVGLEGVLLTGAFTGYLTESLTHQIGLGFLGGMVGGLAFGVLMAVLAVEAKVDQIVAGIALNLLGLGLTTFGNQRIFTTPEAFAPLPRLAVPGLAAVPVIGPGLFRQDAFVYATALAVLAVGLAVTRTTWGIGLRATGESPVSADAAGVSVRAMRWSATLFSALCAGAAGAYISIGDVGVFRADMTGGRGYLALAAVLFGGWRLRGALVAVAIFGVADAVELRLQASGGVPREVWIAALLLVVVLGAGARLRGGRLWRPAPALVGGLIALAVLAVTSPALNVPVPLWLALPYVLALVALAGDGKRRHRPPAALAVPYRRSEA
jgi:simple sugar transport system permease protein